MLEGPNLVKKPNNKSPVSTHLGKGGRLSNG